MSSPTQSMARKLWKWAQKYLATSAIIVQEPQIRVVCIFDTHNTHLSQPILPLGDILIHCGDLKQNGSLEELHDALQWLDSHPHPHKVFIAGNHDRCLADPHTQSIVLKAYPGLIYLQDSSTKVTVHGRMLRMYGSPHTPRHGSWVFQYPRVHHHEYASEANTGTEASRIWSSVPPLIDVLVIHGPPLTHLDHTSSRCAALLVAVWRVRPRLHVFGHIHAARGTEFVSWDTTQRLYDDVLMGKAGCAGVVGLMIWVTVAKVSAWPGRRGMHGSVMVNAVAVGGLKDDEKRGAIVVDI